MAEKVNLVIDDVKLGDDESYLRNDRLPKAGVTFDWSSKPERIKELKKCHDSLIHFTENYFYIVSVDDGKQKIDLYKAQKRVLKTFERERFVIVCASRQCGKTTIMTAYALWHTCFNEYKTVVIVANKEDTAIMILKRIKMAYEELPNWLKPGVEKWGDTSVEFANNSKIFISTTTGSAIRGQTVNVVLIDEMSHIPDHLMRDFWSSVVPSISSSRKATTKLFAVSTPKGTANVFSEIYNKARNNEQSEDETIRWHAEQIDWWEVPGRGKKWKEAQIAALNGDMQLFKQEFENEFIETGETIVDKDLLDYFRRLAREPIMTYEDGKYRIWQEPIRGHIYGIGVDVSEGVGRAASVVQVLDFTDLTRIEQVAVYAHNNIHPLQFAEVANKIGRHWGCPPMLVERNNCGAEVINSLIDTHEYPNVVSYNPDGEDDARPGVYSHTNTRYAGIMNMRYWINALKVLNLYDINTVQELSTFVRQANGVWKASKAGDNKDDRIMALVWCLFVLVEAICQQYYDVTEFDANDKPMKIGNYIMTGKNEDDNAFVVEQSEPAPMYFGNGSLNFEVEDLFSSGWRPLNAGAK